MKQNKSEITKNGFIIKKIDEPIKPKKDFNKFLGAWYFNLFFGAWLIFVSFLIDKIIVANIKTDGVLVMLVKSLYAAIGIFGNFLLFLFIIKVLKILIIKIILLSKRTKLIIVSVIGLIVLLFTVDFGFLNSTIKGYVEVCFDSLSDNYCYVTSDKFKINKKNNTIIRQSDITETYNNCSILNRKNWTCKDSNEHVIGFNGGSYFDESLKYKSYIDKSRSFRATSKPNYFILFFEQF